LDEPYDNENEISDIAIATKKKNIVPPKLLRNIYANLERLINQYPITTWINGLMKGYSYVIFVLLVHASNLLQKVIIYYGSHLLII